MPILRIRNKDGSISSVPAIKGDAGKSAYEYAKEGGFAGTEEEFKQKLAAEWATANEVTNVSDTLNTHKQDTTIHVTSEEKQTWNDKSNFSGLYTDLVGKPTIPTNMSQLTNDSGYLVPDDISGKLDTNKLPEAIDTALAQAKASGEFDGEQGIQGPKGDKGDQGVSGVYVGSGDIPEGYNVQIDLSGEMDELVTRKEFNQLSEQIVDLDISKVEQSDLEAEVENQLDGAKADIVTQVLSQLGGMPVFGTVDDNNTITLTTALVDGDYIMVYENDEGTLETICEFTVGNGESNEPTVNEYEVDIASIGYTDNARWSISDGTIRTGATGYTAINLIPITRPNGKKVIIELSGIAWINSSYTAILPFMGDEYLASAPIYFDGPQDSSHDLGLNVIANSDNSVTIVWSAINYTGFKFCGYGSGANAKITYRIE